MPSLEDVSDNALSYFADSALSDSGNQDEKKITVPGMSETKKCVDCSGMFRMFYERCPSCWRVSCAG